MAAKVGHRFSWRRLFLAAAVVATGTMPADSLEKGSSFISAQMEGYAGVGIGVSADADIAVEIKEGEPVTPTCANGWRVVQIVTCP